MTSRRPHGFIYALLALSLAVNMMAVGYLGYFAYAGLKVKEPRGPRNIENTIEFVSKRYPKSVGDKVRAKLLDRKFELAQAHDELKVARRASRRAMREDPVNKEHVETAFAALREKTSNFQKLVHAAIVDALPELPEADRDEIDKGSDPEDR
ncbi:periplasmic heavy metal sensor [Methylopila sp. M107]|uniref:periplasmic heavy metal sensor n=1 Tax=Methylopila sp. M107 TaxID=1101190 RepID=UPI0003661491|nr:periplasmic heavy metal sensor [Methylopila sp. M107]